MMEIIGKITISEVMLLFILFFVLPGMAFLVHKLRRYEVEFGPLPELKKKKKVKKEEPAPAPASKADAAQAPFSYRLATFLSPADKACLGALREALGGEVEVFPKVALWEVVEPSDGNTAVAERLHGKDFDFLVCDKKTGQPLTAVAYKPGKGRPAGPTDDLKKICAAADANVVFIEMAENYDAKTLKDALGIPELEI